MVLSEKEANDLGLPFSFMRKKFKQRQTVKIGSGEYIITDLIQNFTHQTTYRLIRKEKRK